MVCTWSGRQNSKIFSSEESNGLHIASDHNPFANSNSLHPADVIFWHAGLFINSVENCAPLQFLASAITSLHFFVIFDESDLLNVSFTQTFMSVYYRGVLATGDMIERGK